MLDNQILYPRFCDIAGLTGILYAFVSYARSKYPPQVSNGSSSPVINTKDRNRELKKLLEKIDNPNQFTYDAAGLLYEAGKSHLLQARLWRSQQTHFMYDEARRLLQEIIPAEAGHREEHSEKDELALTFHFDDICKVYALLYGTRYTTEKAQRDFAYELKLSLYSRFPELRPGNQN